MKKQFRFVCLSSLMLAGSTALISSTVFAEEVGTTATVEVKESQSESGTVKFKDVDTSANIIFEKLNLKSTDVGAKVQQELASSSAKIMIEDTRKNYSAGTTSKATLSVKAEDAASTAGESGMLTKNMTLKLQPTTKQSADGLLITKNTIDLDKNNKDGGSFLDIPYTEGSAEIKTVTLNPELNIPKVEELATRTYGTVITWTLDTSL